jgi:hypothetical protein
VTFRYPGDPSTVPLPNGTEVTTRVDRGRVPGGAVGRVVAQKDGHYEVQVVGGGRVIYARDELLPRKAGQLRWARRRAADWDALAGCVVLRATVGSRAWGLADEGSDTDERGAFVLPFTWTGGLAAPPEDLVSADGSATFWEAGKLVRQALRADPNTLELLFVGAQASDEMGDWILAARDAFVSRHIYGTFGRYAVSQLKKLEQSARLAQHRGQVLAWLREDPSLSLDALADKLAPTIASPDPVARAKEYIKQLYRSLHDQGLTDGNSLDALRTLAREDLQLPRELRPKNAYNLLRLIGSAIAWLRSGTPSLRVEGPFRDELLAIKRGEVPLDEVLRRAEARVPELEEARLQSPLPAEPDVARADALLRRLHQETARRFVAGGPGPFGGDAPALPEITVEEET